MRTIPARPRAAWVTLTGTGAAASVAFGLLVFASVLASLAIPRESVGLRNQALDRVVATSQASQQTVMGTVAEASLTDEGGLVQASDIATVGASLRARLVKDGLPLASDPPAWAGLTTGFVPGTGTAKAAGYGQPQFELTYRSALGSYSQVVAGRLPVGGSAPQAPGALGASEEVQAAVTSATAARFGLRVGSRLNAGPVQVVITGIIRPADPTASFWTEDLVPARPELTPAAAPAKPSWTGALFIGAGGLPVVESQLNTDEMNVTWMYQAALGGLTAGQAGSLEASFGDLTTNGATLSLASVVSPITGAPAPFVVSINSKVSAILSPFVTAENAAAPVLELLDVSLAIMGAVVVLLGARLVGQRRAAEFTLMRARGAALYQLGWLVLRASLVIAVIAGAAATAVAVGLTPGDGDAVAWWLAGLTIAVTLAGPVLISVVPQRVATPISAGPATGRTLRPAGGRGRALRRIVIETGLVALAIGGLVVLRNEGPSTGSNSLYASAAPVLIAIPVAVVVLRGYPPLVRELARIAGLSRGVVAFVGLARATRAPAGTVLPSFALVLVLAMVAFPDMVSTSVTAAQAAASWQQVGADAIIQAPSQEVISPALQRQIAAVPGVVATAPAEVDTGSLPAGFELPVVLVDPARYAAVVDEGPGPRFPLAALSGGTAGSGQATVFPAAATADAASVLGTAPTTINLDSSTTNITVQLAGQIGGVPGLATGALLVVPEQAVGPSAIQPNLMLVGGPALDAARLTAVVRAGLPGAALTLRATALGALTTAPVLQATQTAFTQGIAAAAGFGVLVLLLSLLLTAQTRDMTLALIATMGLRRWQAQLLLAAETLPPVVAAAVGGVACAWLLAPLIGPSLNLAAFTGTGSAVVVTPAATPLLVAAIGLVLAALLVLAVQAVITYHRGSTRALRIAD